METVIHYIHDPLCGWCYAAESLIEAVATQASGRYEVRLHAGGLFGRTMLSDAMRSHIRHADTRIAELTGQVFGQAYLQGLLGDPGTIYDSAMPIRGILAAEQIRQGTALAMLRGLQHAHYREGRRVAVPETIVDTAVSIGLDAAEFAAAFEKVSKSELDSHLDDTRRLMGKVGARGYPTFILQQGTQCTLLPHERFYGDATGFAQCVSTTLEKRG